MNVNRWAGKSQEEIEAEIVRHLKARETEILIEKVAEAERFERLPKWKQNQIRMKAVPKISRFPSRFLFANWTRRQKIETTLKKEKPKFENDKEENRLSTENFSSKRKKSENVKNGTLKKFNSIFQIFQIQFFFNFSIFFFLNGFVIFSLLIKLKIFST